MLDKRKDFESLKYNYSFRSNQVKIIAAKDKRDRR